jgi:cell wall-associated NlpC family hydrolase
VQLDPAVLEKSARGRHRATGTSAVSRVSVRAAVAAVTTGTVAVSGVALAGCSVGAQHDGANLDEASLTSPIRLGAVSALAGSTGAQTNVLHVAPVHETVLKPKDGVSLTVRQPNVTVSANTPTDVGFQLYDTSTHRPLANQKLRVQRQVPAGWATFKYIRTDATGYAHYAAKVLTTTRLTAVFDGSDALKSAHAGIGTLTVPTPLPPQPPVQPQVRLASSTSTANATTAAVTPTVAVNTPAAGSSLGQRAVYLASLQRGKPYVYGGSGPYSFDCSGLVQYIFKQLGRSLPRTAEEQYEATTHVSQFSKQVGDLIFFGTPGNIYHVGIYAGNGTMWDAPNSGQTVQLQSIWTTSYSVGRVY